MYSNIAFYVLANALIVAILFAVTVLSLAPEFPARQEANV